MEEGETVEDASDLSSPPMRSLTFWMTMSNLVSFLMSTGVLGVEAIGKIDESEIMKKVYIHITNKSLLCY